MVASFRQRRSSAFIASGTEVEVMGQEFGELVVRPVPQDKSDKSTDQSTEQGRTYDNRPLAAAAQQTSDLPRKSPKRAEWSVGALIALSIGLLILAIFLIIIEFLVISGGLIGVAAGGAAIGAIVVVCSSPHGWIMVVLVPIVFSAPYARNPPHAEFILVTQATIDGDAGYEHVAEERGVKDGSLGELVTDAFPTGHADLQAVNLTYGKRKWPTRG